MGRRKVPDLYRAPFPLYTVKVDPKSGMVITAGGGGASKTGIKNALFSATLLHSHDTETRATMNMAVADGVIAAGQDGSCSVMRFKQRQSKDGRKAAPGEAAAANSDQQQGKARRRAGKGDRATEEEGGRSASDTTDETPQISVETVGEVQSDLNPVDPLQKVYPSLKKKYDFKAHEGEIEDLDLSPGNEHLVTVGRDFACSVWSGNQLCSALRWQDTVAQVADRAYRYMACRFGRVEDQKDVLRLYTVQIPHKRDRRPPPCYLTKWDGQSFLPMLTATCGAEVISSMTVSDSGTFIGLGTVTGSVAIYIAFSLQKLYYVQESHGIVVTDVAFLPDTLKGRAVTGGAHEAAMLSVAVDSRCQLHTLRNRRSFPIWLVLGFCAVMVVAVILLLQSLFPGFM
ncbi:hypothetical protein CRUP_028417 [Coryphaenoides rupestris]|nr:hypothetical protein CRUP_028417 [Coryphaenoides rupestris]